MTRWQAILKQSCNITMRNNMHASKYISRVKTQIKFNGLKFNLYDAIVFFSFILYSSFIKWVCLKCFFVLFSAGFIFDINYCTIMQCSIMHNESNMTLYFCTQNVLICREFYERFWVSQCEWFWSESSQERNDMFTFGPNNPTITWKV